MSAGTIALIKSLRGEIKDPQGIRKELETARKAFEEQKRQEWAKIRTRIVDGHDIEEKNFRVRHALLELHEAGATVSSLCEVYGTKDRRTIMNLIQTAKEERGLGIRVGREEHLQIIHIEDDLWSITVENFSKWEASEQIPYSGTLFVRNDDGYPVFERELTAVHEVMQPLHREVVSSSPESHLMQEWASCVSQQS